MDVSPALNTVDALAAFGRTSDEGPILLLSTDQTRLSTNTQVDQAPAHARELTANCRPEPHLHLQSTSMQPAADVSK